MMRLHPESFINGLVKKSMVIQGLDITDDREIIQYMVEMTMKNTRDSDPELWDTYREAVIWLNRKMYEN
jgi:hypothetical protein